MNKFSIKISAIFITVLFLLTLVFADTNGVWHEAKDVRGGIFGQDEQDVTSFYLFLNRVTFNNSVYFNKKTEINANLDVNGELKVNGYNVSTLDSSGKVPITNLPFHKGDLLAPQNRQINGALLDTYYFDLNNLGISGSIASKVAAGTNFGLNGNIVGTYTSDANATSNTIFIGRSAYVNGVKIEGTLSLDSLCSSAGGTATCGATSTISVGSYYSIIGSNSPTQTNYCSRIDVSSTGSVSSQIIQSAGLCKQISSCSLTSQSVSNYPDLTSCSSLNLCQNGNCYSYTWKIGTFGACSKTCGGGTQIRTVECQRNDGQIVSDSFCVNAGSKPISSQSCNTQSCIPECSSYNSVLNAYVYDERTYNGEKLCVYKQYGGDGNEWTFCNLNLKKCWGGEWGPSSISWQGTYYYSSTQMYCDDVWTIDSNWNLNNWHEPGAQSPQSYFGYLTISQPAVFPGSE